MSDAFQIAIDFDGTIMEHTYPVVGNPVPGAIEAIRTFQDLGAECFLWTVRSGSELEEAVQFCHRYGITFTGVNFNPTSQQWVKTAQKIHANVYIDDRAFGCPMAYDPFSKLHHVDWSVVTPKIVVMLREHGR